jgi:hypothetical protein
MPQFDTCHQQVVSALQKDGWRIVAEQSVILAQKRKGIVDIRAAREINGSRQQIMLVEVKCFPDREDTTQELYTAIGQYIIYRAIMVQLGMNIPLYLAVPDEVFANTFDSSVRWAISDSRIKLIIVDIKAESVRQWIE